VHAFEHAFEIIPKRLSSNLRGLGRHQVFRLSLSLTNFSETWLPSMFDAPVFELLLPPRPAPKGVRNKNGANLWVRQQPKRVLSFQESLVYVPAKLVACSREGLGRVWVKHREGAGLRHSDVRASHVYSRWGVVQGRSVEPVEQHGRVWYFLDG